MATIQDKIKACNYLIHNILDEQERIVYKNEDRIISMNVAQFEDGKGSDDKNLFNTNKIFTGFYKYGKENVNPGQLYNFYITGDFLSGLELEIRPNLVQLDIFSTGTGSGDKSLFFKGYTNLFGLNKNNNRVLNYDIIYPDLIKFIKKYL